MKTFLIILWRFVKALPLILLFPILLAIAMAALALVDLVSKFRKKSVAREPAPEQHVGERRDSELERARSS